MTTRRAFLAMMAAATLPITRQGRIDVERAQWLKAYWEESFSGAISRGYPLSDGLTYEFLRPPTILATTSTGLRRIPLLVDVK